MSIRIPSLPSTASIDDAVATIMDAGGVIIENFLSESLLQKLAIRKSGLKRDQSSPASIMRMSVEMSAP